MLNKRLVSMVVGLCMSGVSTAAFAWGMPSIGGGSSGGTSPAQAMALQSKILGEYLLGEKSVLEAQSHYATAYGDKRAAAKVNAVIKTIGSGATVSKKNLQTATRTSRSVNKRLRSYMAHKTLVTAASRKQFLEGTAFYAGGVLALTKVVPQLKNFMTSAQGAIRGASFTQALSVKHKLATGMYLAESTPPYVGGLVKTSKDLVSYAHKNNIRLPASATSALGNLS